MPETGMERRPVLRPAKAGRAQVTASPSLGTPRPRRKVEVESTEEKLHHLRRIRTTNGRLYRAYQLRVDFEQLWECSSETQARDFLASWTRAALLSRRKPLRRFAKTVREHLEGILGF
ncbi:MAG TPA: hypothetical protein EYP31_08105 [Roseibacterium sp.]|nr:hypothetical protein [Roseibacterium sp.]